MANQRPRRISDLKPTLTNLAQTSHYAVNFGSMSGSLSRYLEDRGVDKRFIGGDLGLLCNAAALPFASLATSNVTGGYTGITEKFAHSRMYVPITLTFYVDKEYKVLKFLEHWMEFIAGGTHAPAGRRGSVSQNKTNYFIRMQYPDDYRMEQTQIIKFERDYSDNLQYTFFNLFPQNVTDVQVGYDQSKILTASATFEYTRYVSGPIGRISKYRNSVKNNDLTVEEMNKNIELRAMNANIPDVLNAVDTNPFNIDWSKFYNVDSNQESTAFPPLPVRNTNIPGDFGYQGNTNYGLKGV